MSLLCASRAIALASMSIFLFGCAYVKVDADGQQRIIGLVYLNLPSTRNPDTPQLRTRVLGLQIINTPWSGGISVGYSDHSFLALSANSCVRISPIEGSHP